VTGKKKNPAAVALGRLGGAKKVPKGFSALTKAQRIANARKGAKTRWAAVKKAKAKEAKAKKGEEEDG
jgi:hypothetical protein